MPNLNFLYRFTVLELEKYIYNQNVAKLSMIDCYRLFIEKISYTQMGLKKAASQGNLCTPTNL